MCVRGAAEHFHITPWYFNMSAFATGGARLLALLARGGTAALRGGAAAARGGAAVARGAGGLLAEAPMTKISRAVSQGIPEMSNINRATGALKTIKEVTAPEAQKMWQSWLAKGVSKFPKDATAAKNHALEQFAKWGKKNPEQLKAISPSLWARTEGKRGLLGAAAFNAAMFGPLLIPFLMGGEDKENKDQQAMLQEMMSEGGMGNNDSAANTLNAITNFSQKMGGSSQSGGGMMDLIAGLKNRASNSAYETSTKLAGTQGALKMQGLLDAANSGTPTAFYRNDLQDLTKGYEKMLGNISYQEPVTMAEALARRGIVPDQNENRIDFRNMM